MTLPTHLPSHSRPPRPLRTVLIGTLLESESDPVVRAGLAMARAAGACVHLVHAIPDGPRLAGAETGLGEDFSEELRAWCEEKLREQIDRLGIGGMGGMGGKGEPELAGAEVMAGEPHRVLIDTARTAGADLIVVGATASSPSVEPLGSTADRVLRKAACPVLLVRGELRVPPERVLAPVDLSPLSGGAFRRGLDLLAPLAKGARIEVRAVHALSFLATLALWRRKHGEISFEEAERHDREELRRFVQENQAGTPFEVETAVLPGEARFEILHELGERPVDLVILGTHGRGGLDRLMVGSVASTIARKAPCSVLLISPDAALAESVAEAAADRTTDPMVPAWQGEPAPVA